MDNERAQFKKEFRRRLVTFTVNVLQLSDTLRKNPNLWSIADQLARSSASVGANVAEAQGSASRRGYTNYFHIALRSAREVEYWLEVLASYASNSISQIQILQREISEIAKILSSSILTLKGRK